MEYGQFLSSFLNDNGWQLSHTMARPARAKTQVSAADLPLSSATRKLLKKNYPDGPYVHQLDALKEYLAGSDVTLATGTASGKSAVFYLAAVETLARYHDARVIALYPLKALAREQENRWKSAMVASGFQPELVGRIDGDVSQSQRPTILSKAQVLVATPDIIHAWLVPNIQMDEVWAFMKDLRVIVCDEVHVYTGVFGSNAAFLFRRLEHVASLAGARYQCIAASATIKDPERHLSALMGRSFKIIGEEKDTSPRHEVTIKMVVPPPEKDLTTSITSLLGGLVKQTDAHFIAFVDSRKQVETVATILARSSGGDDENKRIASALADLDVLPYRSGFEDEDREEIERRLSEGKLRGVVSTSALELGIDIPHLDFGVLVGVPRSGTSLQQRIGRIGRRQPGMVVIVNSGDLYSEAMFQRPEEILDRPLGESALYLENSRVQYIHAMCLARPFGEHDRALERVGKDPAKEEFKIYADCPKGFEKLCRSERAGNVPPDLQNMKVDAGDTPHYAFPLRDVETQFSIELKQGSLSQRLGSMSHSQLMREAYPGAVYYHIARPYRVVTVSLSRRTVRVRYEKRYTTKPSIVPSLIYPDLGAGSIFTAYRFGNLFAVESNVQVKEMVTGFKERRGPKELPVKYPFTAGGLFFRQPYFTRTYFTTGVVILHEALSKPGVKTDQVSNLLYECFLMEIPFERQDVNYSSGVLRAGREPIKEQSKFVTIYDQTYGSLRLSGRILERGVIARVFTRALELARSDGPFALDPPTLECIEALHEAVSQDCVPLFQEDQLGTSAAVNRSGLIQVILPGSVGVDLKHHNEDFVVEDVFYSPQDAELRYRGRRASITDETVKITVPIRNLVPIPGESQLGWYNPSTGEILQEAPTPEEDVG